MTANVVLMCYFLSELKIVATDTIIAAISRAPRATATINLMTIIFLQALRIVCTILLH